MSRYKIWHHWTGDPDRTADPDFTESLPHGYWVLKFDEWRDGGELVGVALWRRKLAWKPREYPGLTVKEAEEEYPHGMIVPSRKSSIGLRDLPKLAYKDDPELVQALRVVEAREEVMDRLPILTAKSPFDVIAPGDAEETADWVHKALLWAEEATHALSYDGWTLECVIDDELIAEATRHPLSQLLRWASGLSRWILRWPDTAS